jgi:ATP-binding cassette subfamily B multidrug efflux pump
MVLCAWQFRIAPGQGVRSCLGCITMLAETETSQILKRPFWFYIKRHKVEVILGLTWLLLTNSMETLVPWLVGKTLDQVTSSAPMPEVGKSVGLLIGITLFLSVFRFLWRFFWSRFHHAVADDLRNRVFNRMTELGPSFFRQKKIGDIISLISNDVNSFRMGIGPGLLILFDGIFLSALILPMMISISWTWTWQTLALMPFVPFTVKWILDRLHLQYHQRQERFADMAGVAQETVSGIRVIKSFAQEKPQVAHFNTQSSRFTDSCNRVAFWDSIFGPALELPVALGCVLLLLLGTSEVINGQVTLGQFFAFYQYIQRMIWPMSAIGVALGHVQEGRASFKRIAEVLQFAEDVPDAGTIEISELESLEVRNLSFAYPGSAQKSLEQISFVLKRGQSLGVVGMTGSGKSTLIELLIRQQPAPPNSIFVNGFAVERIRKDCLRRLIAMVPQDPFLFTRPVADNIALGVDNWTLADVERASAQVRLDREIANWPEGYQALVGERGVNLSGGQKQRMTLARALIREAQLVILDDALSAVDAKTEQSIQAHLRSELTKTTSIVVSHRLASVRDADQILVLQNGRAEAVGSHAELLSRSSTYQALSQMQSGRELHEGP